jgi:Ran GTPase-activating protein (RanGAP) involved in mRNA processing and transport
MKKKYQLTVLLGLTMPCVVFGDKGNRQNKTIIFSGGSKTNGKLTRGTFSTVDKDQIEKLDKHEWNGVKYKEIVERPKKVVNADKTAKAAANAKAVADKAAADLLEDEELEDDLEEDEDQDPEKFSEEVISHQLAVSFILKREKGLVAADLRPKSVCVAKALELGYSFPNFN